VIRVGNILGSTRPGRRDEVVAKWVCEAASQRTKDDFELIDLGDHPLPHWDEPMLPSMGQYQNQHTKDWAVTISRSDGFIFMTPEYNHSTSGVLKDALDAPLGEVIAWSTALGPRRRVANE